MDKHEFLQGMTDYFQVLSDPTRLRIIRYVATKSERLCVAEIAARIGISVSAVSQHMKILRQAKIVNFEKAGNQVYYFINMETIKEFTRNFEKLMEMVFSPCEQGDDCEHCQRRNTCAEHREPSIPKT